MILREKEFSPFEWGHLRDKTGTRLPICSRYRIIFYGWVVHKVLTVGALFCDVRYCVGGT